MKRIVKRIMKRTMPPVYRIILFVAVFHFISLNAISAMAMFEVDFRDPDKFGGHGDSSFSRTLDGLGLELSISANPGEATLWRDNMDGYGVQYNYGGMLYDYEEDEIQGSEYLGISFSESVTLESVLISDLFYENGYRETGLYSLNGGESWTAFQAESDQILEITNGETGLHIDAETDSIIFAAPGIMANQNHDFSIAGLSIRTVETPIPPVVLLLGSGVFGLGLFRSRFLRKH